MNNIFTAKMLDGQEKSFEKLFTIKKDNIDYIVYLDEENNILASRYSSDGTKVILSNIDNDSEWEMICKEISIRTGE